MGSTRLWIVAPFLLISASANAQTLVKKSFDTQLFEPAIGLDTMLSIEPASVANHLSFGIGFMFNYARKPFSLYTKEMDGVGGDFDLADATEVEVVKDQMTADFGGAIGLHYKWLHAQIGLALPVHLMISGNEIGDDGQRTGDLSATAMGDLRLQLKVAILRDVKGFSLAFSPIITFPTGDDEGFGGDPNVSVRPRVAADYRIGPLLVAANLGWLFRENTTVFSSEIGDRLMYGLGASFKVHRRAIAMAELSGQAGFSTKSDCSVGSGNDVNCASDSSNDLDAYPLEALLGGRVNVGKGVNIMAGLGFGLVQAIGSPKVRVLVGLRWMPNFTDTDKDGIYDVDDKCPTQPEDIDTHRDDDGCPDPDNDGDLIPDDVDKCPLEAEDKDTFQDDDGCPEPDNDNDGIPDIKDTCPFKPETKNGFKDDDGCPDVPDKDGDGVQDSMDRCPTEPEDKDTFQDEDGCPDPDNDADGVPDQFDDCPLQPEDADNFKDDDGCPDPDNDNDGVPDAKDKCPNKPETINGIRDTDGCPDRGKSHVIIQEDKIVITKKVFFATGKSIIRRRSNGILNEVALTLMAHTKIKGIRIEGHTDSRGNADRNKRLSQARAEAVRDYLIKRGIAPSRLFAVGYGPERPIATNKTNAGRKENRRVEFVILEQAPGAK